MIKKIIAGLAIISSIVVSVVDTMAQKPDNFWVAYNSASALVNNPLSFPTRPSRIDLQLISNENTVGGAILANYKFTVLDEKISLGGILSKKVIYGEKKSIDALDLRLGYTKNKLSFGMRIPFEPNDKMKMFGISFQSIYSPIEKNGTRIGFDLYFSKKFMNKTITLSADIVDLVADNTALSTTYIIKEIDQRKYEHNLKLAAETKCKIFKETLQIGIGVAGHPERLFLRGPQFSLRHRKFDLNYSPKNKEMKIKFKIRI